MCRVYSYFEKNEMTKVRENQTHICFYCKRELKEDEITIDHMQPFSRGGETKENNLVIACKKCNQEKDIMTLKEYINFLEMKNKIILEFKVFEDEFTNQLNNLNNEVVDKSYKYLKKHDIDLEINLKLTIINCLRQEKELIIENLRKDFLEEINEKLKREQSLYNVKQKSYPLQTEQIMYITNLKISDRYRNMNIKDWKKYKEYKDYFIKNEKLKKVIDIDEDNFITNVDSYINYLILKKSENILVPVCKTENMLTLI